ncbi:hypothetical protein [Variovorax sp. PAMC 28711]|uniref:hypothetical protein n=1 Tax=Variovorax sp. PAMC 28711 TaxID=1795631 RepID=UPI00078B2E95|nr:hypothetical protein [Variovorax sp. PAMC 28711]AMM23405.1 hypothetical protein AX767_02785 [Variovorax sp. PAMC 28711]
MTHFATIHGHVTYTPGDGVPIGIPEGRVEVDLSAPDSATLSWDAGDDAAGLTAIPIDEYERYLKEGKIRPEA